MDANSIKNLSEIVKTLNLNFNGTFNSDTLRQTVQILAPYYKFYLLIDLTKNVAETIGFVAIVVMVGKIVTRFIPAKEKDE